MPKRKTRKTRRSTGDQKYKAFNAFLMLVILFFILFFIAQLPKRERMAKEKKAVPVMVRAPEVSAVVPSKSLTASSKAAPAIAKAPLVVPKTQAAAPKTQAAIPRPAPKVKVAFKTPAAPIKIIEAPSEIKGRIAIVIDDWGYHLESLDILDGKLYPITAAIIPNLNYSRGVAEALHSRGYEIILHLPMEPIELIDLEKATVMTSLSDRDIRHIVDQDISGIPYVKGINNHMGSRATSDLRTMEVIFKEIKRKHLYFLDSYVSSESVCSELAPKLKVSFARRDVFLDNNPDPDYIRNQILKLKLLAGARGWAIGIGHDRKNTLEVLKEEMPKMEKEGYKFVYLSELVK